MINRNLERLFYWKKEILPLNNKNERYKWDDSQINGVIEYYANIII